MNNTSIRDNHNHENVGDFFKQATIKKYDGSIVYAYQYLNDNLGNINKLRGLFCISAFHFGKLIASRWVAEKNNVKLQLQHVEQ
jgi:hypothetical protein